MITKVNLDKLQNLLKRILQSLQGIPRKVFLTLDPFDTDFVMSVSDIS